MSEKPTYEELENQILEFKKSDAERKNAEDVFHERAQRFRNLTERISDWIWEVDLKVMYTYSNPKVKELLGYEPEELIGKTPFDFMPVDEAKRVSDYFHTIISSQLPFDSIKNENIHKNGSHVVLETSGVPIFSNEGEFLGYRGIDRDITDRLKIEEELRRSEAKHKTLVNNIPGMVYRAYPDWSAEVISGSEVICGFTEKELNTKDKNWLGIIHADDIESVFENGSELTQIQKNLIQRYRIHTKEGDIHWVEDRKTSVFSEKGDFIGIDGIVFDITDNKRAEEEKLIAQQIAAEHEKYSLVGQIAGKMAHDFNNILAAIMGNTELALLDCTDTKIEKRLELIFNQTIRGKNLTRNLVAFAKDQEPKQEYFRINDKIELVLNLLQKELENIDVIREYASLLPDLLADPGMIEHALVNLVQNSIHATSLVKQPKIVIRTYQQDKSITIEIEDNGCGIPEKFLEKIFEPAFTLKGSNDKTSSYKSDIKGTGYGMSNVKKYIDQHKGNILIASKVKKGTKTTIDFPVIEKELTKKEIAEVQQESFCFEKYILLVEDEQAISDVQYHILTSKPCFHKVDIATNGQLAIDLFNRNRYDFVSLDYLLPGEINGMDVYHHIRESDKTIPILFVSGNLEFLESTKALQQRDIYIDHLSKPCLNFDYIKSINKMMGSQRN